MFEFFRNEKVDCCTGGERLVEGRYRRSTLGRPACGRADRSFGRRAPVGSAGPRGREEGNGAVIYSPDPELDPYVRRHERLYLRTLRRAVARHPGHTPRFLLGMAMQVHVNRMFRRRLEREARDQ